MPFLKPFCWFNVLFKQYKTRTWNSRSVVFERSVDCEPNFQVRLIDISTLWWRVLLSCRRSDMCINVPTLCRVVECQIIPRSLVKFKRLCWHKNLVVKICDVSTHEIVAKFSPSKIMNSLWLLRYHKMIYINCDSRTDNLRLVHFRQ